MTKLISSEPVVVFKTHLEDQCSSCQGFTIISESGKLNIQGAFHQSEGKYAFMNALRVAEQLQRNLSYFLIEGRAKQLAFCKQEIEWCKAKLKSVSLTDSQKIAELERRMGYNQDIILVLSNIQTTL